MTDKEKTIVIVDYGMGNLRSILKVFHKLEIKAVISSQPDDIQRACRIILPGVGHFAVGMKNLRDIGLIDVLNHAVLVKKKPVLGICLGMQLLTNKSEEGHVNGLGWIEAETVKFISAGKDSPRIPHMGWNSLKIRKQSCLMQGLGPDSLFYFVHSYHVQCQRDNDVLSTTHYGITFTSSVERENIFGTQFHPEKSHTNGIRLLENFCNIKST